MPRELKVVLVQPVPARDLADLLHHVTLLYNVAYFTKYRPPRRVWGKISNYSIPDRDVLSVVDLSAGSFVGRALGASDAVRKAVSWTKRAFHIEETRQKIRAEAERDRAEARRALADARRLDAEARKIDAESRALDVQTLATIIQELRSTGHSEGAIRQLVTQAESSLRALKDAHERGQLLAIDEGAEHSDTE